MAETDDKAGGLFFERPQPRSIRLFAAIIRAAAGAFGSTIILTSVLSALCVCLRAKERISNGALAT